jgi:DNA polymerase-3 subunit epsilon
MHVLVWDTETTGLTNDRLPSSHASQPDLVQLGAILVNQDTGQVRGELNLIVKPEGRFTSMPSQASDVHGITYDVAEQFGVPLVIAMAAFNNLSKAADAFVAFNASYDRVVTEKAYHLLGKPHPFQEKPVICAKEAMDPIMQLPPTPRMIAAGRGNQFKAPNLREAYAFVTGGGTFEGAHDAMADVRATAVVYRWWVANQAQAAA